MLHFKVTVVLLLSACALSATKVFNIACGACSAGKSCLNNRCYQFTGEKLAYETCTESGTCAFTTISSLKMTPYKEVYTGASCLTGLCVFKKGITYAVANTLADDCETASTSHVDYSCTTCPNCNSCLRTATTTGGSTTTEINCQSQSSLTCYSQSMDLSNVLCDKDLFGTTA